MNSVFICNKNFIDTSSLYMYNVNKNIYTRIKKGGVMIILKNARIIKELTGNKFESNVDIFIKDDLIVDIKLTGESNLLDEWQDAKVISMEGCTVLPGLIEGHLHLDLCGINTFEENVQTNSYRVLRALKLAQNLLVKGYTTIRDVGDRDNIVIDLAKSIDEGLHVGPSILASGKIISPTEIGNEFFGTMYLEANSITEFRKAVRLQYQRGANLIKVMGTGAVMNPGGKPGASIILEEELKEVCDTARLVNLPVAVHCHGTEAIKMCIRNGVRTIEHSTIMDDECIEMYKNTNESFAMPTMSPMTNFIEFSEGKPKHYVEKAKALHKQMVEGLVKAREANLKLGWATDAGVYVDSHGDGIYEFKARVNDAGFTPLECIIQATKNNAEILMIDDIVGTLEVGKKADILICNGKPDVDIEAIDDVKLVIKSGRVVNI